MNLFNPHPHVGEFLTLEVNIGLYEDFSIQAILIELLFLTKQIFFN